MEECIFCKIVKGEIPCKKIFESNNFLCILDNYPIAEGHTLIISKKHFETILNMPLDLGGEFLNCVKYISSKFIKEKKAGGFNLMQSNYPAAQQEIPHLHFHLVPRRKDDGLKFRFRN